MNLHLEPFDTKPIQSVVLFGGRRNVVRRSVPSPFSSLCSYRLLFSFNKLTVERRSSRHFVISILINNQLSYDFKIDLWSYHRRTPRRSWKIVNLRTVLNNTPVGKADVSGNIAIALNVLDSQQTPKFVNTITNYFIVVFPLHLPNLLTSLINTY